MEILFLSILIFLSIFSQVIKPATLGQLLIGMVLAIPIHYHSSFFANMQSNSTIANIAEIGSIFLLFEIGLESSFKEITQASIHAIITALVGVTIPFICGFFILKPLLFANHSQTFAIFLGSMLAITSTGISIAIFKELGILKNAACQVVLAASVIDDIIGLILISIVSALAISGFVSPNEIFGLLSKVAIFFVLCYVASLVLPPIIRIWIPKIKKNYDVLLLILVSICFGFAYLAHYLGLASIIGAFIAGMILRSELFSVYSYSNQQAIKPDESASHNLSQAVSPFGKIFIPIFFIHAGMQVDLIQALNLDMLGITIAITIIAIASKAMCGIFLPSKYNRVLVGMGMIPRGEIGIIFASTALALGLIDNSVYTALLLMVIITSIITPIGINWVVQHQLELTDLK